MAPSPAPRRRPSWILYARLRRLGHPQTLLYLDGSTRTKFMSFADDPKHPNEYIMNLATGNGQLKTGVRWWDTSGQQMPGGVPLLPPSGTDENAAFSLVDGEWHVIDALPVVTADAIEAQFPFHMDKKFRAR